MSMLLLNGIELYVCRVAVLSCYRRFDAHERLLNAVFGPPRPLARALVHWPVFN